MPQRLSISEQDAIVNDELAKLQETHCLPEGLVSSLINAINIECDGNLENGLAEIDRVSPAMYEEVIGQQIARRISPIRRIDKKRIAIDEFHKIPTQERIRSLRETLRNNVRSIVKFLTS